MPGRRAGERTLAGDLDAVHEHVLHAVGLGREALGARREIADHVDRAAVDALGLEHAHVGVEPLFEPATLAQAEQACGRGR